MRIVLLSMFNNSTRYLDRYFEQIDELRGELASRGHMLRLLLVEGDSTDDTWIELNRRLRSGYWNHQAWQHHHGNQVYGSIEHPQRFAQLSRIWNEMLDQVKPIDDMAIIVESDLIWQASDIISLLHTARMNHCVVAPKVVDGEDSFYDVWGYRRNGVRFSKQPPYHPDIGDGLLNLDSAGSCLAMPAAVARTCRTTEEAELVGFCEEVRAAGHRIYLNPEIAIEHDAPGVAIHHPDHSHGKRRGTDKARHTEAVRV